MDSGEAAPGSWRSVRTWICPAAEVKLELLVRQRLAQVVLEDAARLDGLRHLVAEEAEGAAAVGLGAIQRHVGVLEQRIGGHAARGHGDADAGADLDQMIVDLVAFAEVVDDAAGEGRRVFAGLDVLLGYDAPLPAPTS